MKNLSQAFLLISNFTNGLGLHQFLGTKTTETNKYRHSSIYAVNMETQNKNRGSKNRVNRGYLIGEENRIEIYTMLNLKIAEIETVEIKECLYTKKIRF